MNQWVIRALAHSGISQAELSRQLSERLGRTIDRAAVQKMTKQGGRAVKADELLCIAEITGYPPDERTAIPIVGYVRAGPDEVIYETGQGPYGMADAPPESTDTTVAVVVRGGSMSGKADDGDLVYFDRRERSPTDDMVGRLCVVGLTDGRIVVKKLHRSNGSWLLISTNSDPIVVDHVSWAAPVVWIKPR